MEETPEDPVRLSCGHRFCSVCIGLWLEVGKRRCAVCRKREYRSVAQLKGEVLPPVVLKVTPWITKKRRARPRMRRQNAARPLRREPLPPNRSLVDFVRDALRGAAASWVLGQ